MRVRRASEPAADACTGFARFQLDVTSARPRPRRGIAGKAAATRMERRRRPEIPLALASVVRF